MVGEVEHGEGNCQHQQVLKQCVLVVAVHLGKAKFREVKANMTNNRARARRRPEAAL